MLNLFILIILEVKSYLKLVVFRIVSLANDSNE